MAVIETLGLVAVVVGAVRFVTMRTGGRNLVHYDGARVVVWN